MTNDIQENNSKDILFDEQLEQQILGCILIENKVLQYIELDLNEDSFYYNDYKIYDLYLNFYQCIIDQYYY